MSRVYLDNNATTRVRPEVVSAMAGVMSEPVNASSVHAFGANAKKLLEQARDRVANFAGAEGNQVIFTGSGTEANNLAIKGFKEAEGVLVSATEHVSVLKPAEQRKAAIIPVDENGIVNLKTLESILKNTEERVLVSIMLANNETGVIQPIEEIARLVYSFKGYLHCDAVQAFGKIPVSFNNLNVDMMTISAHKFGGPIGAAALIIKKGLKLSSVQVGGGQELGFRAGTENVPGIVGFGVATELSKNLTSELRDYLEDELTSYAKDVSIFGKNAVRTPNTSCIAMPGMPSETQLISFDLAGIAVSAGSACSSGKVDVSHVLLAQGVDKQKAATAIRVSLGIDNTKEEIDKFIEVWKKNYDKTQNKSLKAA